MNKKVDRTLMEQMRSVSPCLARMMAVESGKGRDTELHTIQFIADRADLKLRTVQRLIWRADWERVDVDVASKYLVGCGVRPFNQEALGRFLRQYGDRNFPQIKDADMYRRFFKTEKLPIDVAYFVKTFGCQP